MLKVSAFYLEKQKSFIPKKNIFLAIVNMKIKKLCLLTQFSRRFWFCQIFFFAHYLLSNHRKISRSSQFTFRRSSWMQSWMCCLTLWKNRLNKHANIYLQSLRWLSSVRVKYNIDHLTFYEFKCSHLWKIYFSKKILYKMCSPV